MSDSGIQSDQLPPEREQFAELYAVGENLSTLSMATGMTERTLRRWLKDPRVKQLVQDIRSANVSSVSGKIQGHLTRAVETMAKLMDDEDPRVRLAASRFLMDNSMKLRAVEEYDLRLKELESKVLGGVPQGVP